MATWEVTAPDGSVWDMEGPDDATPEQLEQAAQQHFSAQAQQPKPDEPDFWDSFEFGFDSGRGVTQLASEKLAQRTARKDPGKRVAKPSFWEMLTPGVGTGYSQLIDNTRAASPDEVAENEAVAQTQHDLELEADHPRVFHNEEARGSAGSTIGRIVRTLVDPTTMLGPVAGAGLKGVMATNALIAAADSAVVQVLEDGSVDAGQVAGTAALAAALGPVVKGVAASARGVGKLLRKSGEKPAAQDTIMELTVEVGARRRAYEKMGLNPEEAMSRATYDVKPDVAGKAVLDDETGAMIRAIQRGPDMRAKDFGQTKAAVDKRFQALAGTQKKLQKFEAKMNKQLAAEAKRYGNAEVGNIYRSAYDAMSRISPRLGNTLRKYEFNLGRNITSRLSDKVDGDGLGLLNAKTGAIDTSASMKAWAKVPTRLRQKASVAMFNGDTAGLDEVLKDLPAEVQQTVNKWRALRNEYRTRIEESGHGKLEWVDEYFPREFVDSTHMKKHFLQKGVDGRIVDQSTADLQRMYGDNPDSLVLERRIDALNKHVKSPEIPGTVRTGRTSQMQQRTLSQVGLKDLPAMRDPLETMAKYVNDVESNLAKRQFFGVDPNDLSNSIGARMDQLVRAGNLTAADGELARRVLQARFVTGERSMSSGFQTVRNLTNMALLGNPASAMVQLGDVAVGMAHNGVRNTLRGMWDVMGRKAEVNKIDLGITEVAAELNQHAQKGTGQALDWMLTKSGFRAADTFGKHVSISGSLNKLRGWANKAPARLETKYKDALNPSEMQALTGALRGGNKVSDLTAEQADLVRYALFTELSDMQPVSLSELPVQYLNMRNGRMLYQLKSFTLKQFELVRREFYNKLKTNPGQAISFGSKYLLAMGLLSGSVDFARNGLTGKYKEGDENGIDEVFWNGAENVVLSASAGLLNRWTTDSLFKGDIQGAVADMVLPPVVSMASRIGEGVAQDRPSKALRYIPMLGVFAPWGEDK